MLRAYSRSFDSDALAVGVGENRAAAGLHPRTHKSSACRGPRGLPSASSLRMTPVKFRLTSKDALSFGMMAVEIWGEA